MLEANLDLRLEEILMPSQTIFAGESSTWGKQTSVFSAGEPEL